MNLHAKLVPAFSILMLCLAGAAHSQGKVRAVNEGGIRDKWMLAPGAKLAAPGYPAALAARGDNVCVAIGYRIHADGSTGEFSLLKAWSSGSGEGEPEPGYWDAFSQASAAALGQWKFTPRPEVDSPDAVDTVATMTFMGKQAEDPAGLRAKCKIDDLVAYLEQVKVDMNKRGDMNRRQLDDAYRQQLRNEARANQAQRGR